MKLYKFKKRIDKVINARQSQKYSKYEIKIKKKN